MGNTLAFSRRVPAILTATFATSALGFLALTASLCSFAEVRARPGEILFFPDATTTAIATVTNNFGDQNNHNYLGYSSNDDDWYNRHRQNRTTSTTNSTLHHEYPKIAATHQVVQSVPLLESTCIGILQGNEYYDAMLQDDLMYLLSRICLILAIACGSFTTILAWALSTFYPPTDANWKLLGVFGAISAVVQMPMFLLFETDPCTEFPNHQQCELSYGSFFLILSTVFWSAVTLATQCLDPPLWAVELNAWRVKDKAHYAQDHQSNADDTFNANQVASPDVVHRRITDAGVTQQIQQKQRPEQQQQPQQQKDKLKPSSFLKLRKWGRRIWTNSDCDQHMELPQVQTESLSLPEDASPKFAEMDSYYARSNCSRLLLQVLPNGKRPGDDAKSVTTFGDLDSIVKLAEEGRLNESDTFHDEDFSNSNHRQYTSSIDQDQCSHQQASLVIKEENQTSGEASKESPETSPSNIRQDYEGILQDGSIHDGLVIATVSDNNSTYHESGMLPQPNLSDVNPCNDAENNNEVNQKTSHADEIKPATCNDENKAEGKAKMRRITKTLRGGGTSYQKLGSPPSTPNSRQSPISMITDRLRQSSTRLRFSTSTNKNFSNTTQNQERDKADYVPAVALAGTDADTNAQQKRCGKRLSDSEQQLLDDWNTLHQLLEKGSEKHFTVVAPETSCYSTDDDDKKLLLSNYGETSSVHSCSSALRTLQSEHCSRDDNKDNHSIDSASSDSSTSGRIVTHTPLEQEPKENKPQIPSVCRNKYHDKIGCEERVKKHDESSQKSTDPARAIARSHSAPDLANSDNSSTTSSECVGTNTEALHQSSPIVMVPGNTNNDINNARTRKSLDSRDVKDTLVGTSCSIRLSKQNENNAVNSPPRVSSTSAQANCHPSARLPGSPFSTNLSTIPKVDTTFATLHQEADISNSFFNTDFSRNASLNLSLRDKNNGLREDEEGNCIDKSIANIECNKDDVSKHLDDESDSKKGLELIMAQPVVASSVASSKSKVEIKRSSVIDAQLVDDEGKDDEDKKSEYYSCSDEENGSDAEDCSSKGGVDTIQHPREVRIHRLQLDVTRRRSKTQEPPLNRRRSCSAHSHNGIIEDDPSSRPTFSKSL